MTSQQETVWSEEFTLLFVRLEDVDFYQCHWFLIGELSNWTGFMDDFGTFVPVDWC